MIDLPLEEYQVRTGESFRYAITVDKAYGILDDILDWCRANMLADWRWQLISPSSDRSPGKYTFYFDSDRDCCAFKLRWV